MTYQGHVQNGVIVLDDNVQLPEGTPVRVEAIDVNKPKSLSEKFQDVMGKAKGMPADFAENHDHYIHGAPKE